jgi:tyrosyl-tRNA synthetase
VIAAQNGTVHLPAVIAEIFGRSRSEARRTLAQGGVKVDGTALAPDVLDIPAAALDGRVLQLGKRHFRRIRIA